MMQYLIHITGGKVTYIKSGTTQTLWFQCAADLDIVVIHTDISGGSNN
jgi:ABC-type tungstate transport system permease subunit